MARTEVEVLIAYATPELQVELKTWVPLGVNVAYAIRKSGVLKQFNELDFPDLSVGIFSKKCTLETQVERGDRIEIYRPLQIDPKQARFLRLKKKRS